MHALWFALIHAKDLFVVLSEDALRIFPDEKFAALPACTVFVITPVT